MSLTSVPPSPRILVLIKSHDAQHGDYNNDRYARCNDAIRAYMHRFEPQVRCYFVMGGGATMTEHRRLDADTLWLRGLAENHWEGLLIKVMAGLDHFFGSDGDVSGGGVGVKPPFDFDFVLVINSSTVVNIPALIHTCTQLHNAPQPSGSIVAGTIFPKNYSGRPYAFPSGLGYLLSADVVPRLLAEAQKHMSLRTHALTCERDSFPSTDDIFIGWTLDKCRDDANDGAPITPRALPSANILPAHVPLTRTHLEQLRTRVCIRVREAPDHMADLAEQVSAHLYSQT
jgi:hypothetical protein